MYLNIKNIKAQCAMCEEFKPCNECIFGYIYSRKTESLLKHVLNNHKETCISEDIFKIIDDMDPWFPDNRPTHIPKTINIKNMLKYWLPVRKLGKVKPLEEYLKRDGFLQFCKIQPKDFIEQMRHSIEEDRSRRKLSSFVMELSNFNKCLCLNCAIGRYITGVLPEGTERLVIVEKGKESRKYYM